MNFCNVQLFLAGEAIFSNDELGSQSGSFLPAKESFFHKEQRTNQSSYLVLVFRYNNQLQRKMFSKLVYRLE